MTTFCASNMQDSICWLVNGWISSIRTPCAQEAKDKEKKLKAAGGDGGAGAEEMLLQISTLTAEKRKEEELRNYMQLERVDDCKLYAPAFSRRKLPPHEMISARTCLINECALANSLCL